MAAAEARAAWQRIANRCFVREDAERAPKLACCQSSSSSSSSKQSDSGPNNPSDGSDHLVKGFVPPNKNSPFSTLSADMRWWVQKQFDYGHQTGLSQEQLKALEIEVEISKFISENPVSTALNGAMTQKSQSICTNDHDHNHKGDSPLHVCTKMAVDVFDCKPVTKHSNEFGIDLVSSWIKVEKTTPWWRTTDIAEIAYLVPQRTHKCVRNCDLPPPQKLCLKKYEETLRPLVSEFDLNSRAGTGCGQECVDSVIRQRKQEMLARNSGKSFSCSNKKDNSGARPFSEGDSSKAELLEALRHSQTRAREAERAAKQAHAEKEYIVDLFFKQASQLFAYRQWLRLLQFDQSFDIQKEEGNPLSDEGRTRRGRKNSERQSRRRRGKQGEGARDEIGKYGVAFAVGLSLVAAGLLLGWTVGWMLPPF